MLSFAVAALAFAQPPGNAAAEPLGPAAALAAVQARPGFRVEQVFAEPAVMDPVHFAFGADKVLWVVEMADYPLGLDGKGKPGGRVRRIERFDEPNGGRNTVFLDGLAYPTSVIPLRKGVLVACAAEVLYAEDTDGDGVADRRETMLDRLHVGNPQHLINGFDWGLDNWLYLNNVYGRIRVAKTGKEYAVNHRDARWRPDTGELEPATGPTQYGRTRDDWDRWIGGDNSHPMWQYLLPDHYLRRNPQLAYPTARAEVPDLPGPAPVYPRSRTVARFNDFWAANRFTSACRPCVYRDDLFGPGFRDSAYVSEPVHNLVNRQVLRLDGLQYRGRRAEDEQRSEFLAATDNWFRPTTIACGPDGCLWVADMYRHVIEHPEWIPKETQAKLDLRAGHDKGRIYRVVPAGVEPRTVPHLAAKSNAELVAAFDSPGGWQRDTVQRLLLERHAVDAAPLLAELATTCVRPQARLHALCTLDGLERHGGRAVRPTTGPGIGGGPHGPPYRMAGKLLAAALKDRHAEVRRHAVRLCEGRWDRAADFAAPLLALAGDDDLGVRQQLAFTLGDWHDPRAADALAALARRDGAKTYVAAAVLSSLRPDNFLAVCKALGPARADDAPIADQLWRLADEWRLAEAGALLATRLAVPPGAAVEPWRWTALGKLLETLDRRGKPLPPGTALAPLFGAARATAANEQADPAARGAALAALGWQAGRDAAADDALLRKLLVPQSPAPVLLAVVEALARKGDFAVLASAWRGLPPAARAAAAPRFLDRPAGQSALLEALAAGALAPADLDAATRGRLLAEARGELRKKAVALLGGAPNPARAAVIDQYRPILAQSGDAARGQALFQKACAACHRLGGVGNAVGPDLSAARAKSREFWLESILDPNRAVEARFVAYLAELKDGRRLSGVVVEENATAISLAGPDGKIVPVLRGDLVRLVSTGKSAMPEGLERDVPPAAMADLLAFLAAHAPQEPPRKFPGNAPTLVVAAAGKLVCKASAAEIHGNALRFEREYGNLGYWTAAEDRAEWRLEVPKAGRYAVALDYACPADGAGQGFLLTAGAAALAGRTVATGGWDGYRTIALGELLLPAGAVRMAVRASGPLRTALFDLRTVTLTPRE